MTRDGSKSNPKGGENHHDHRHREGPVAAHREIVLLLQPVEMNAEGQVFGRLEQVELLFEEQRVGAQVDVLLPLDQALHDRVDLGVHQRLAARNADDRRRTFVNRAQTLLGGGEGAINALAQASAVDNPEIKKLAQSIANLEEQANQMAEFATRQRASIGQEGVDLRITEPEPEIPPPTGPPSVRPAPQPVTTSPIGAAVETLTAPLAAVARGVQRVGGGVLRSLAGRSPLQITEGALERANTALTADAAGQAQSLSDLAEIIQIPDPETGEPLPSDVVFERLRTAAEAARSEGRENEFRRGILEMLFPDPETLDQLESQAKFGITLEPTIRGLRSKSTSLKERGRLQRSLGAHGIDSITAFETLFPQSLRDLFREE